MQAAAVSNVSGKSGFLNVLNVLVCHFCCMGTDVVVVAPFVLLLALFVHTCLYSIYLMKFGLEKIKDCPCSSLATK